MNSTSVSPGGLDSKALAAPPPAGWRHESNSPPNPIVSVFRIIWERTKNIFLRQIIFRGNRVAYLRHLGVRIGSYCYILSASFGSEPWLVELGNRTIIASGVMFVTHDGSSRIFRQLLPESSIYGNCYGTIQILDNSFIGANCIILPDVVIGPNSIVGAGSVVNKDVPPNTVAAGVPAKPICSLEEYVEKYKSKMLPISATNRQDLRKELTLKLWGEVR